jgi:hypothetical protein
MRTPPKAVIHINFDIGNLVFDARPIRTALADAAQRGTIPTSTVHDLLEELVESGLYLATRHCLMSTAVQELKTAIGALCELIPENWIPPPERIVRGPSWERKRDHVLLAVDSFLFEFRSFLDLLARFAYDVLVGIGKGPPQVVTLSSGQTIDIIDRKKLIVRKHNFLRFLTDQLGVSTDWYDFLVLHRNFLTHQGAPYCAIDHRNIIPAEYDVLIMTKNITDFSKADPADFFRVSECQDVVNGVHQLSLAIQEHLVKSVRDT